MDRFFISVPFSSKPKVQSNTKIEKIESPIRKYKVDGISDDFYSNLLDWERESVIFGVQNKLRLLDYHHSEMKTLKYFRESLTAVKFNSQGTEIALGFASGSVHIFDLETQRLRKCAVHRARVGIIDWSGDQIYTGSRDRTVQIYDKRQKDIQVLHTHEQEVCGLKVNTNIGLVATGGNDNKLFVIDVRKDNRALMQAEHLAAVKALSWSRYNLLASGGGTADKSVKIWDIKKLKLVRERDFQAQICNLYWTRENKLVSTHGYSRNDVRISNTQLEHEKMFYTHKNRVIHFAMNENEDSFITGCGDNYLRVWEIPENKEYDYI